jgi:hypothetical protein
MNVALRSMGELMDFTIPAAACRTVPVDAGRGTVAL